MAFNKARGRYLIKLLLYKIVSNIGLKQVNAADGFLFPWKICGERKRKEETKQFNYLLYASLLLGNHLIDSSHISV